MKSKVITFEVDTGAAVTIMSSDNYRHHFPNETISNSTLQLTTYTRNKVPLLGEVKVPVSYYNQGGEFMLYIMKGKGPNLLLGHNWLEHLILDSRAVGRNFSVVRPNSYRVSYVCREFRVISDHQCRLLCEAQSACIAC